MPDETALVERLAEAIYESEIHVRQLADPGRTVGSSMTDGDAWRAARAVLSIVEDYAKAERKAGAADHERARKVCGDMLAEARTERQELRTEITRLRDLCEKAGIDTEEGR